MSFSIRHTDKLASVALLVLAILVFIASRPFPSGPTGTPGAAFFPRVIAGTIGLLAIVQLAKSLRSGSVTGYEIEWDTVRRVAIPTALVIGYMLLLPILGFLVDTILYLVVFMHYSGVERIQRSVPVATGVTLVLFYVFVQFLHVPLPESAILPISRLLPQIPLVMLP